jgi:hypothetical protein
MAVFFLARWHRGAAVALCCMFGSIGASKALLVSPRGMATSMASLASPGLRGSVASTILLGLRDRLDRWHRPGRCIAGIHGIA